MSRLAPMLASVGSELPDEPGWVFEPKYDGIRVLAIVEKDGIALISRNGLEKTRQFPEIVDALRARYAKKKKRFAIDGEIVAVHGDAPARFQSLQSRMHVTNQDAIDSLRHDAPAALFAFDILLDGKASLVTEPWRVRRKHLAALLQPPGRSSALRLSDVGENGAKMLREARRRGWEGVIAKRADAPYLMGRRSRDWRKLKIESRQEFVVGGWTEPRNSREHLGALLLGYHDADGKLVYAGHTGTGFTRQSLADLYAKLKRIERRTSPFTTTPRTNQPAHWTRPSVVVEIKFNEWTSGGHLRQPVFVGMRDDKDARDVVQEPASLARGRSADRVRAGSTKHVAASVVRRRKRTAKRSRPPAYKSKRPSARGAERVVREIETIEAAKGDGELTLPSGTLEVSNLGKVFFPKTKTTKGDVMRYYAHMAPYILPAVADRPLVMKRFPNGVRGPSFYQQKAPPHPPESVRVESVSDDGMTTQDKMIGGDLATLLYLVQLGAISIDPWHSRVQSIPYADYAIIDLDPGPRARFSHVIEVALAVKETLDDFRLHAVPKTSGASGLHIVLPLPARVPNDGARTIAQLIATRVAERHPRVATVERSVRRRPRGTIYVDYLQNIRGKTVAGVYSVRAQDTPTVSTPLSWDEIDTTLDPREFTIDTVPRRVHARGDLWAKGMRRPNKLDRVVARG